MSVANLVAVAAGEHKITMWLRNGLYPAEWNEDSGEYDRPGHFEIHSAECSCGWRSADHDSFSGADAEAEIHLERPCAAS